MNCLLQGADDGESGSGRPERLDRPLWSAGRLVHHRGLLLIVDGLPVPHRLVSLSKAAHVHELGRPERCPRHPTIASTLVQNFFYARACVVVVR